MPILEIEFEGEDTRQVPVGDRPLVIGSDPSCGVTIQDPVVARQHLRISLEWCIQDLSRDHPVFLGGRRITRDWLRFGDLVSIGNSGRIRLRLKADDEEAPPDDLEGLRAEVRRLQVERSDLTKRVRALEAQLAEQREHTSEARSLRTTQDAQDAVAELRLGEPLTEEETSALGAEGIDERLRSVLGTLITFVDELETMTFRVLSSGGGRREPGATDIRRQVLRALRAKSTDLGRDYVANHLDRMTKIWVTASLQIYRQGVEGWAQTFLGRLSPKSIQIRAGINDAKLDFGIGYKRIWKEYRQFVNELTSEILVEEIDDAVKTKLRDVR